MNITQSNQTPWQIVALTTLRIAIGWHFLNEGLVKVMNPGWSAYSYLNGAVGPFASLFKSLASNPNILEIINILNQWGLVLVGLGLMLGLLTRWACLGGIALLALYYFANPPFIGLVDASMVEGNYLIVNKNLIELFALWVLLLFPGSKAYGIDRFLNRKNTNRKLSI